MNLQGYNINFNKAIAEIKKKKYQTIAIQIPEGLKNNVIEIVDYIKTNTGCNVIVIADPCFGACDIPKLELKDIGVEFALNIGHTKISYIEGNSFPILFLNAKSTID